MSVLLNDGWNNVQAEQWGDGEEIPSILTTSIFVINIFAKAFSPYNKLAVRHFLKDKKLLIDSLVSI